MNSACGDAKERPCDAAHTPHFQRPAKHAQSTEGQPAGQHTLHSDAVDKGRYEQQTRDDTHGAHRRAKIAREGLMPALCKMAGIPT